MIKNWILSVLDNIPKYGVLTLAKFYSKQSTRVPHWTKILSVKRKMESGGIAYNKLMLTDSDLRMALDRVGKYTCSQCVENIPVGEIKEFEATQTSTIKTKRPRVSELVYAVVKYNDGDCVMGADMRVVAFTHTQFNDCQLRFNKHAKQLIFDLSLKERFAKFLGELLGIYYGG